MSFFWFGGAAETPGGQTVAIGVVTETDTALPVERKKTKAIGTVTETDTAMPIGKRKRRTVGVATETDTAMPLGVVVVPTLPWTQTWTGADGSPWPYPWTEALSTGAAVAEIRSNKGFAGPTDDTSFNIQAEQAQHANLLLANVDVLVDISETGEDTSAVVGLRCTLNADLSAGDPGYSLSVASFDTGGGLRDWSWSLSRSGSLLGQNAAFLSASPLTALRARFQAKGTTIRLKLWDPSGAEPGSWTFSTTDSGVTAAGYIQLVGQGGGAAPFGPSYDNLTVSVPQISEAIGTVTESDSAMPVGHRKTRAIGTVTETDTARPIARTKVKAIGFPTETDTAMPIGKRHTRLVGFPTETDTAMPITRSKRKTVGLASEADTAMPIGRVKRKAVGFAVETDTAMPLGKVHIRLIGFATETDTARPIGKIKLRPIGTAVEIDTAGLVRSLKTLLVGTASETDFAIPMVVVKGQADFVGIIPI